MVSVNKKKIHKYFSYIFFKFHFIELMTFSSLFVLNIYEMVKMYRNMSTFTITVRLQQFENYVRGCT
jgi:hypothetical protein